MICPLPSSPQVLLPQHETVPLSWSAQVCASPVAMAVASSTPATWTGAEEDSPSLFCPLPSCPAVLLPQHEMVPSRLSAQECPLLASSPPAAMAVASSMPVTGTGTSESSLVPLPSCPCSLLPQQAISPVCCRAQVWLLPAATAIASLSEGIEGGEVSESLPQLAASSAREISRQRAREVRGGGAVA